MDSKSYIDYTKESVSYWDEGWRLKCETHPPVHRTPITDSRETPALAYENKDKLRIGNHILALPYWNEVGESVIPDVAGVLQLAAYQEAPGVPVTFGYPKTCKDGWRLTQRVATLDGNFGRYSNWTLPELPTVSESEMKFLIAAADTKALSAAHKADANIAMIIKERRETLLMVANRVSSIAGAASKAQRDALVEWRSASRGRKRVVAEKLANLHLELVFGWKPLLADIQAICDSFSAEPVTHIKVRGTHGIRDQKRDVSRHRLVTFPGCNGAGYPDAPMFERVGTHDTSVSVRTALRFEIKEKWLHDASAGGFDPIGFAFDAYPLSFVSGWVSNFDHWVRSLSPLMGIEFTTGSRTVRREAIQQGMALAYPVVSADRPAVRSVGKAQGEYYLRKVRWEREPLYALPTASFQFQNNFSWFSVTAAASLLVQRYNKPLARALSNKRFWRINRDVYTE